MPAYQGYSRIPLFVCLAMLLTVTSSVQSKSVTTLTEAQIYLSKYGYLSSSTNNIDNGGLLDEKTWKKVLCDFQKFAGLNATGVFDSPTKEFMSLSRCGVHDRINFVNTKRTKRYVTYGGRWPETNLTYKILNYPSTLNTRANRSAVDAEIARAFRLWSNYSNLTITQQQSGDVDIEISFVAGNHNDGFPFDGRGNILAHAFTPTAGGRAHFDDDEEWTIGVDYGSNIFQVAAHELGHSLGLFHSDVRSAVMAPFYRGYDPNYTLDPDDIAGIQHLYGKKSSATDNGLCKDPKIDAILNLAEGERYVFKDDLYYVLNGSTVVAGYPKSISDKWKVLPGNIDGACTPRESITFFFKDDKYWAYNITNDHLIHQGDIERYFGISGHFDAVMYREQNDTIYFFKDDIFWSYGLRRHGLKKDVLSNKGLPNNLDAAFEDEKGHAYFFKDDKYYRLDDKTNSVDVDAMPPYPRPIGQFWFDCKSPL